jgi:hypothetical protein
VYILYVYTLYYTLTKRILQHWIKIRELAEAGAVGVVPLLRGSTEAVYYFNDGAEKRPVLLSRPSLFDKALSKGTSIEDAVKFIRNVADKNAQRQREDGESKKARGEKLELKFIRRQMKATSGQAQEVDSVLTPGSNKGQYQVAKLVDRYKRDGVGHALRHFVSYSNGTRITF